MKSNTPLLLLFVYTNVLKVSANPLITGKNIGDKNDYRKVASSRLSQLVAHLRFFRLFMKGKRPKEFKIK